MDMKKFLLEALESKVKEQQNAVDLKEKIANKIRVDFESQFGCLGIAFWSLAYTWDEEADNVNQYFSEEKSIEYSMSHKNVDNWNIHGISRWASVALTQGHPIVREYEGIENYMKTLGNIWYCIMERDDKLIILSNYPNRCGLIKGV